MLAEFELAPTTPREDWNNALGRGETAEFACQQPRAPADKIAAQSDIAAMSSGLRSRLLAAGIGQTGSRSYDDSACGLERPRSLGGWLGDRHCAIGFVAKRKPASTPGGESYVAEAEACIKLATQSKGIVRH